MPINPRMAHVLNNSANFQTYKQSAQRIQQRAQAIKARQSQYVPTNAPRLTHTPPARAPQYNMLPPATSHQNARPMGGASSWSGVFNQAPSLSTAGMYHSAANGYITAARTPLANQQQMAAQTPGMYTRQMHSIGGTTQMPMQTANDDAAGLQQLLNSAGATPTNKPPKPPASYGAKYLRDSLPSVPTAATLLQTSRNDYLNHNLGTHSFNAMMKKPAAGPEIMQAAKELRFAINQNANTSIAALQNKYNALMQQNGLQPLKSPDQ
jgi:hypothetical protein